MVAASLATLFQVVFGNSEGICEPGILTRDGSGTMCLACLSCFNVEYALAKKGFDIM